MAHVLATAAWTPEAISRARDERDELDALLTLCVVAFANGERSTEAGKMRFDMLRFSPDFARVEAVDYESAPRGTDLTEHGRGKKQSRRKRTSAYAVPADADFPLINAPVVLADYVARRVSAGRLCASTSPGYLFLTATGRPMDAPYVTARLKRFLTDMGECAGETSHSLCRGGRIASPLSNAELARLLSLTTETIALYRDVRR
jgi:hypothetical protein